MNDDFETFWKHYPKRVGPQNKSGARASFQTRVKQGVDPQKIIAAAKVYAIKRDWVDGVGTYQRTYADRLIPMAQTWLNQKRYEDYVTVESAPVMSPEEIEARIEKYRQRRIREGWTSDNSRSG